MTVGTRIESDETMVRLFSDAYVLDVDLTRWHERIALLICSDHFEDWSGKDHQPAIAVIFHQPRRFEFTAGVEAEHADLGMPGSVSQPYWSIDGFLREKLEELERYRLSAGPRDPVLSVTCGCATYSRVEHSTLDQLFPNWRKPSARSLRQGFVAAIESA